VHRAQGFFVQKQISQQYLNIVSNLWVITEILREYSYGCGESHTSRHIIAVVPVAEEIGRDSEEECLTDSTSDKYETYDEDFDVSETASQPPEVSEEATMMQFIRREEEELQAREELNRARTAVNKWSTNLAEAASEDQVGPRPDSLWHSRFQIALLEEENRRRLSQARQGEHQHDAPQPATPHSDAV
jgi:hypothetical protein